MPADRIHLIRHGEVHNPGAVLYGRLPHFHLSERGRSMAAEAAAELKKQKRKVTAVFVSPLLRTRESAEPIESTFGLTAHTDERLIEPWNLFEGRRLSAAHVLTRPKLYWLVRNPRRPSWGEPYDQIAARMFAALEDAWKSVPDGDVVLVSHQLPIEMVYRSLDGKKLAHSPRSRRTRLSSITSLERKGSSWIEVGFADPAATSQAIDRGAV
ncbi:MAG: histidine phosphatase family protein [Rhodoluna sp.]